MHYLDLTPEAGELCESDLVARAAATSAITADAAAPHAVGAAAASPMALDDEANPGVFIVDMAPHWSSAAGGAKVILVTSVALDRRPVCAQFGLAQVPCDWLGDNVLRCYTPPHAAGVVSLSLAYADSGAQCTGGLAFEFRRAATSLWSAPDEVASPLWHELS